MFEDEGPGRGDATPPPGPGASAAGPVPVSSGELAAWVSRLGRATAPEVGEAERIDRIRLLEELKSAAAAAQARETVAFDAAARAGQAAEGTAAARVGRGIAAQVGLARRESPARAARYTGWAKTLVAEMPHTLAALGDGRTTEWRAMLVARETVFLSRQDRAAVDAALAGRLGGLGDRAAAGEARRLAARLDPHGQLAHLAAAEADRRVSLRPAPELMARLTAILPMAQGVAVLGALSRAADTAATSPDPEPRNRAQIMADTLVARVTGQATAADVPVEINLIVTDRALFAPPTTGGGGEAEPGGGDGEAEPGGAVDPTRPAGAEEPAELVGHGPIPAWLARHLVHAPDPATPVWVRRLYTDPATGALVGLDSRRRLFPAGLRRFLVLRDRVCRTPYCDAPIRHADHVTPAADGGPTTAHTGAGRCAACNYAKQAPGWTETPGPGGAGDAFTITTPTGHTYPSPCPPLPGAPAPAEVIDDPPPPATHDPPGQAA